jgi:hypothetical protein
MKKKHVVYLSLIGLFWFIFLVIAKIPAGLVLDNLVNEVEGFDASNVRGTLWDGEAKIRVNSVTPPITFQKAKWKIAPLKLIFGEFDVDLDIKDEFRFLTGSVRFDLIDHDIHLNNIKGRVDGAFVQPYLNLPFKVEGLADIDIKEFENIDKVPKKLDGRIIIESLKINMGQEVLLGTFAADLSLVDDLPIAMVKLQDIQAQVELSGFAQFTTAMDYYVNIKVKPKATANPLISNTLQSVYRADDQGWYPVVIGQSFEKAAETN